MDTPDIPEPSAGVELAPLPRERVGPFVILGVPKDADGATIDGPPWHCKAFSGPGKARPVFPLRTSTGPGRSSAIPSSRLMPPPTSPASTRTSWRVMSQAVWRRLCTDST